MDIVTAHCTLIRTLTSGILDELERQPLIPLKGIKAPAKAGAYLVYPKKVKGPYAVWALLGLPVYAGKATDLRGRLSMHEDSILAALGLDIEDFEVRFIVLSGENAILACTIEAALIKRYKPVWNNKLTGFGLKPVGEKRTNSKISKWDTLHPGRKNRGVTKNKFSKDELEALLAEKARTLSKRYGLPYQRELQDAEQQAAKALSALLTVF